MAYWKSGISEKYSHEGIRVELVEVTCRDEMGMNLGCFSRVDVDES